MTRRLWYERVILPSGMDYNNLFLKTENRDVEAQDDHLKDDQEAGDGLNLICGLKNRKEKTMKS
jgi:hypothetical protein